MTEMDRNRANALLADEALENVAGGSAYSDVNELLAPGTYVWVYVSGKQVPGRIVDGFFVANYGAIYGVELGYFAEDGVTFVVTEQKDFYAAYVKPYTT